jgi:hypothetical protein
MNWTGVLAVSSLLVIGCQQPKETAVDGRQVGSIGDATDRSDTSTEDAELRSIFDQIVSIVLTSPDLKDSREFYGTADDTRCALVSNQQYGMPWPEWYAPEVNGITFVRADEGTVVQPSNRRLLGIRIDKLELHVRPKEDDFTLFDGPVQITLLNAGGDPEGVIVMGGASVYFRIEWEGGKPKLVCTGLLDA